MSFSRRDFLTTATLGTLGIAAEAQQQTEDSQRRVVIEGAPSFRPPKSSVILCKPTANQSIEHGTRCCRRAWTHWSVEGLHDLA
jgi:hypothetical protein